MLAYRTSAAYQGALNVVKNFNHIKALVQKTRKTQQNLHLLHRFTANVELFITPIRIVSNREKLRVLDIFVFFGMESALREREIECD